MAKSNAVVSFVVNPDGTITFNVIGTKGPMVLKPDQISMPNTLLATQQGFITRVTRAAALGAGSTPDEKRVRVEAVINHLNSGSSEWNLKAAPRVFNVGAIVVALMRVYAIDLDAANKRIDALATKRNIDRTEAAKLWAKTSEVIEALAAIEAEKAPTGANDLLAEIEGMDDEADESLGE